MRHAPSWRHRVIAGVVLPLTSARHLATAGQVAEVVYSRQPGIACPSGRDRRGLQVTQSSHRGWPVWTFQSPHCTQGSPVVVAVHGGGFITTASPAHLRYYADLARRSRARVVVPLYPVAPLSCAELVVPALAGLLRTTLREHHGAHVTVLGDSAGAGLALVALQQLLVGGHRQPDHLVMVSPWLDLAVPAVKIRVADRRLGVEGLRECGRLWAGALPLYDPRVSPVHGSLRGLAPVTVFTGTRDLLHRDSLRLAERAAEQRARVDLVVGEGLIHGWAMLRRTPEGAFAAECIQTLVTCGETDTRWQNLPAAMAIRPVGRQEWA